MKVLIFSIFTLLCLSSCNTVYNHNINCNFEHSELIREISNVLIDAGATDLDYNEPLGILKARYKTDGGFMNYNFRVTKNKIIMNITAESGVSQNDSNYWIFNGMKKIANGIENLCNEKFIILKVE
ncbi:MAG: hypothetical protein WDA29_12085 [Flavobacteriaceae bacterium]|jgi:hypothetical protein